MKGLLMEGNDKEEVKEDENDNESEKDEGEEDESDSDVVDIPSYDYEESVQCDEEEVTVINDEVVLIQTYVLLH